MAVDSFTGIGTTPINAKLYVNGKIVATTPYSALWFKAGDLIKIEKEGYETIQFILSLPQVGTELTFFLTPAPTPAKTYGDVQVKSSPTNAKVYVDRRNTGKTTPALLTLETGLRTITLKKDGYLDLQWVETIRQESRVLSTKFLTQVPIPAPAPISAPAPAKPPVTPAPAPAPKKLTETEQITGIWRLIKKAKKNVEDYGPFGAMLKKFDDLVCAAFEKAGLGFMVERKVKIDANAIALWIMFAPMMTTSASGVISLTGERVLDGITPALYLKKPKELTAWFIKQDSATQMGLISKWEKKLGGTQAISSLVRDVVRTQSVSWLRKALPWLGGAIGVMSTITFISFLYEEALQSAGMGVWVAISNKQWSTAEKALNKAEGLLSTAEWFYNNIGWMAPYSWKVFKSYARATRIQYDVYRQVINVKKGTTTNPGASGKVFNTADFEQNLSKGATPAAESLITPAVEKTEEPAPAEKETISEPQILWDKIKEFYVDRMYMSMKELKEFERKYTIEGDATQALLQDIKGYYVGRAYMSKKEMVEVAEKHNLI